MDRTDEGITTGLLKTVDADMDLAQPIADLMEACFTQAKARNLPPEIMVASALSICVTADSTAGADADMLLELTGMLCALRKHMRDAGLLVRVDLAPERNPATES